MLGNKIMKIQILLLLVLNCGFTIASENAYEKAYKEFFLHSGYRIEREREILSKINEVL